MIYKYILGKPSEIAPGCNMLRINKAEVKKVLDIQLQGEVAVMWAEVELKDYDTAFLIEVAWTGYQEPIESQHIATIQEPSTGLVYHYYIHNPAETFDV